MRSNFALVWLSKKNKKASSTLRTSQAVPHPSTDRAFGCLTSEFGWDRVCSTEYGRWRKYAAQNWSQSLFKIVPPFPTIDRKSYKSSHHFPPSIRQLQCRSTVRRVAFFSSSFFQQRLQRPQKIEKQNGNQIVKPGINLNGSKHKGLSHTYSTRI